MTRRKGIVTMAQVKRELRIITRTPVYQVYVLGIELFLETWQRKTPAQRKRLCVQVQEVIVQSRPMAINIFGSRGVLFFEKLNVEIVEWE